MYFDRIKRTIVYSKPICIYLSIGIRCTCYVKQLYTLEQLSMPIEVESSFIKRLLFSFIFCNFYMSLAH